MLAFLGNILSNNFMNIIVEKVKNGLNGTIEIPPDKSISHRAVMFSALAKGKTKISNFSKGADCLSTLGIIKQLGISADFVDENTLLINSKTFQPPQMALNCGNSGTTMRLMSGILAGQSFESTLVGDESLSKRPMKRIIEPLTLMGANIEHNNYKSPLKIYGRNLHSINYESKIASAQVKSCILLAGLNADGKTIFKEPYKSRNHTELMLEYLGANIKTVDNTVEVAKSELEPKNIEIAGDISSAAFFLVAACLVPNSDIIIKNVGLNPTRTGIIEVLQKMEANIEILDKKTVCKEDIGDIRIKTSDLKGIEIKGDIIPRLIDELPIIAVLASQATGKTIVKDAQDLRNKEADRISCLVKELKKIGADIEETEDGFIINSSGIKKTLTGGAEVECYHDHRLAMSFYVASLIAEKPVKINEFQWVDISFPEFLGLMGKLRN